MTTAEGHTICFREDGSIEFEESLFISLREPDGEPSSTGGGGRVPHDYPHTWTWEQDTTIVPPSFRHNWAADMAKSIAVHDAAVRLGRRGGIASGAVRKK